LGTIRGIFRGGNTSFAAVQQFHSFKVYSPLEGQLVSAAALIVAAGRGSRAAGAERPPKQYWPIGGMPMLTRSIAPFAKHPRVADILVVIHPGDEALYEAASTPFAGRLLRAVRGGARRQDSVRAGLEALAREAPSAVLIHDAARPFVKTDLISRVIDGLAAHQGALPCLPVTDTLKWISHGRVIGTAERDQLWRAQTPQGF
jgi:2-C-methyl-D-erythritol 4-phosphate cytidylyltransferase/2-C-methyl-D-erythritol 2,4-cyclodiphosphate synthase